MCVCYNKLCNDDVTMMFFVVVVVVFSSKNLKQSCFSCHVCLILYICPRSYDKAVVPEDRKLNDYLVQAYLTFVLLNRLIS